MSEKLLQVLAEQSGCFISSLPQIAESGKLTDLLRSVRREEFTLAEWNYALFYIFRHKVSLKNSGELELLLAKLE